MTLLELLIVIGIVAILAGILLETMVSVNKGVRRSQDQLTMTWAAEQTAAGVTSMLRHAVAASALDAAAPDGAYEFAPTKCAFLVTGDNGKGLERATVEQTDASKGQGASVRVASVATGEKKGPDEGTRLVLGTGGAPERFSTTLALEYATKINAIGFDPQFKNQLGPGEYPQLVRMRIRVEDLRKIEEPYEIVTAIRLM